MIKVSNISKNYAEVKALQQLTFEVGEGELFGLIGPDGAGKSTFMRILCTLLLPDSGEIFFDNRNVVSDYKYVRKNVGYMPGTFSLYQDLTVEENLDFFAAVFNTTVKENYYLIKDIYQMLEPFKKRKAGALSGGMKQKLALCCALIHKPMVLVLDEPTTGVDAVSRKEFWENLSALKHQGITIIASTPYMDEAAMCDRIGLIQNGKLLDTNSPHQITHKFSKHIYEVGSDELYRLLNELRANPQIHSVFPFGEYLHVTALQPLDPSALEKIILNNHHQNIRINKIECGIEDYFMDLMVNENNN